MRIQHDTKQTYGKEDVPLLLEEWINRLIKIDSDLRKTD